MPLKVVLYLSQPFQSTFAAGIASQSARAGCAIAIVAATSAIRPTPRRNLSFQLIDPLFSKLVRTPRQGGMAAAAMQITSRRLCWR